jgi:hypothetical protein
VITRRVFSDREISASRWAPALAASCLMLLVGTPLQAQDAPLPPITVGAGAQTSFVHTEPDAGDSTDTFALNSARLYVSGPVTSTIKFMFNTEYNSSGNDVEILDAVGRLEFSGKFNIWFGRFLPPSDRANLYGPYYSHHWAVYTDGVQDGYPFIFQGATTARRIGGSSGW